MVLQEQEEEFCYLTQCCTEPLQAARQKQLAELFGNFSPVYTGNKLKLDHGGNSKITCPGAGTSMAGLERNVQKCIGTEEAVIKAEVEGLSPARKFGSEWLVGPQLQDIDGYMSHLPSRLQAGRRTPSFPVAPKPFEAIAGADDNCRAVVTPDPTGLLLPQGPPVIEVSTVKAVDHCISVTNPEPNVLQSSLCQLQNLDAGTSKVSQALCPDLDVATETSLTGTGVALSMSVAMLLQIVLTVCFVVSVSNLQGRAHTDTLIRMLLLTYGVLWGSALAFLTMRTSERWPTDQTVIATPLSVTAILLLALLLYITWVPGSTPPQTLTRVLLVLVALEVLWSSSLAAAINTKSPNSSISLWSMTSNLVASTLQPILSSASVIIRVSGENRRKRIVILFLLCLMSLVDPSRNPSLRRNAPILLRGAQMSDGTYIAKLRGSPNTGYCVSMQIGTPGNQEFCMLVDTGSANLAIAGREDSDINQWFRPELSSTYEDHGKTAKVSYTSGHWEGKLSTDLISVDDSLAVTAYVVVITKATDFYIKEAEWSGILGLAYSKLAKPGDWVDTFWDSYRTAYSLPNIFSLQLCPPLDVPILPKESSTVPQDGWMVLGGINKTYYHEQRGIHYTSIVKEEFYNVLITNLTVGDNVIDLNCREFNNDQAIVDSGTTDIYLPKTVFKEVRKAFISFFADGAPLEVPEGFWTGGKKLAWPVDDLSTIYGAFPTFNIGFATQEDANMEFSLAVTPQLYLRQVKGTDDEQTATNCFPDCDYFTFGIKQRERGTVLGSNMMLGFYTIFDQQQRRVGFAESTCKYQDKTKDSVPRIVGPYHRAPVDCACGHLCKSKLKYWEVTSYVCGGIVIPLAVVSVVITIWSRVKGSCARCCRRRKKYSAAVAEEGAMEDEESAPLIIQVGAGSCDSQEQDASVGETQVEVEVENPVEESHAIELVDQASDCSSEVNAKNIVPNPVATPFKYPEDSITVPSKLPSSCGAKKSTQLVASTHVSETKAARQYNRQDSAFDESDDNVRSKPDGKEHPTSGEDDGYCSLDHHMCSCKL